MVVADVSTPAPCRAVSADDVAVVGRWAEQQRADLAALARTVHTTRAAADAAERIGADGAAPTGWLAHVDRLLAERTEVLHRRLATVSQLAVETVAAALAAAEFRPTTPGDRATAAALLELTEEIAPVPARDLWAAVAPASDPTPDSAVTIEFEALVGPGPTLSFWDDVPVERGLVDRLRKFVAAGARA